VRMLSAFSYASGPHIAASIGVAVGQINRAQVRAVASDPDVLGRVWKFMRLVAPALLLAAVIWGTYEMPAKVFGAGWYSEGSTFCQTAADCHMDTCTTPWCYSILPPSQSPTEENCTGPRHPLAHCECSYSSCQAVGDSPKTRDPIGAGRDH
jgi:hypothetical protein